MEMIPHGIAVNGLWASLGNAFHPAPDRVVDALWSTVLPPDEDLPASYVARLRAVADGQWTLNFALPCEALVFTVGPDGRRYLAAKVTPTHRMGVKVAVADDGKPYAYVMVEMRTGAHIVAFDARAGDLVEIGARQLAPVNDPGVPGQAGPFPAPTATSPIPADSAPVLVGAGELGRTNSFQHPLIAIRTQHWEKGPESYSLPPCSSTALTLTQTSGITTSSSELATVANAVGVSASVGWGPISASVSASMSRSTSRSMEVTVTAETESTVVRDLTNPYRVGCVVFLWQLVERLTIIAVGFGIHCIVETVVLPAVPATYSAEGGPYPGMAVRCGDAEMRAAGPGRQA